MLFGKRVLCCARGYTPRVVCKYFTRGSQQPEGTLPRFASRPMAALDYANVDQSRAPAVTTVAKNSSYISRPVAAAKCPQSCAGSRPCGNFTGASLGITRYFHTRYPDTRSSFCHWSFVFTYDTSIRECINTYTVEQYRR